MLDPWGFAPAKKDMHISGAADVVQPILFRYPAGHAQAGEPWTPPVGTTAYFLFGDLSSPERHDVTITGDAGLLRIESEVADLIADRTPQRFYVSLPDTPESTEHMLTRGQVKRHD